MRAHQAWLVILLAAGLPLVETEAAERLAADAPQLSKALAAARPGDTVVMVDGCWRDTEIDFVSQGEPGRPIELRAQTPGHVILCGRSRLHVGGVRLVVSGLRFTDGYVEGHVISFRGRSKKPASHCRLTQCAVIDYNPPEKEMDSRWVSMFGRHNRVDHCYFATKTTLGTTLVVWLYDDLNYHRIDHNYFGPRPYLRMNGAETIRIGTSGRAKKLSRTLVEWNLFEGCGGEAEIISDKSTENTFRYNTFHNSCGALTLRHATRATVEGNFFLDDGSAKAGGVRVIGEGHRIFNNYFAGLSGTGARAAISIMNGMPDSPAGGYQQVRDVVIAFNTFVNNRSTFHFGLRASAKVCLPPADCTIANNVIAGKRGPFVVQAAEPENFRWVGNLAHGAGLGIPPPKGIGLIDPRLRLASDGRWRPAEGSPTAGAAEGDFAFVTHDIDGQPRGQQRDMGCDQRSAAPVTRRPLTREMVGPAWMRQRESRDD